MAHKQKYTRGATGHMLAHYDRSKKVPDLLMPANTIMNYNLADNDQTQSQLDFLHQRLSEIKVHNRKDVNVMVDWVVTAPKDLPMDDEDKFFKETYSFLNDRYGKENVISAYVHMDETTPHMHYAFVPVVEDRKKGGYKLSAKEAVTIKDLRTFHGDLSKHLEKVFGHDIGILNEATKDGNKSIDDLKRETSKKELEILELQEKEAKASANKAKEFARKTIADINQAKTSTEALYKHKKALEIEIDTLQGTINALGDELKGKELTLNELNRIRPEKGLMGTVKNVTIETIEDLKKTAFLYYQTKNKLEQVATEYEREKRHIPSLDERIRITKNMQRLEQLEKIIEKLPPDIREQFMSTKTSKSNIQRNQQR